MLADIDQQRLAMIRRVNAMASAEFNTEFWESTFFLKIIDQLIEEKRNAFEESAAIADNHHCNDDFCPFAIGEAIRAKMQEIL